MGRRSVAPLKLNGRKQRVARMDGIFPWGDDWGVPGKRDQFSGEKFRDAKSPAPVGSFPSGASPYGCLNMAGNVSEWCADWFYYVVYSYKGS